MTTWVAIFTLIFLLAPLSVHANWTFAGKPDEAIVAAIDAAVENKKASKIFIRNLDSMVNSEDYGVRAREHAAWALGEFDVKSSVPTLIKAANHKGLLIRSAAMISLSRIRAKEAIPTLIQIAKSDPILPLRQRAIVALAAFRSDKAIDPLVDLAQSEIPELRGASALAMAAMQSKKNDFSQVLKEMAQDESSYVRERAQKGLDIIQGKNVNILNHLKSGDADVRFIAAVYFEPRSGSKELDALKDAWNTEADEDVRKQLQRTIIETKRRIKAAEEKKAAELKRKAAEQAKSGKASDPIP